MSDITVKYHNQETTRLNSFLLAAGASAIGFAMFQTADRTWHWSLGITFLAIVIWGFSFYAGIKLSLKLLETLNYDLLKRNTNAARADRIALQIKFDDTNSETWLWRKTQLYSLLVGAIVYFIGHICKILYDVQPAAEAAVKATTG